MTSDTAIAARDGIAGNFGSVADFKFLSQCCSYYFVLE